MGKELVKIEGAGGGGDSQRAPEESPNTLQSYSVGKLLDLIAFGPIKGLANGLKSVYLDGTPLQNEDDSYNFEGVKVEFRSGTPNQSVIPGFAQVENHIPVATEVKYGAPVIRSITNGEATAALVTLQIQALHRSDNEYGDIKANTVRMGVDYRVDGGPWTLGYERELRGKTMSPWQITWRIEFGQVTGDVDIRVRRVTADMDGDSRIQGSTYWSAYTEVIEHSLNYPDMALVGISVDARKFGNNLPKRQYLVDLSIVKVPSNYDPITREYAGIWDGTFKEEWTDNPAWAFYDLATHPVIGADIQGVDKWELYRIGRYCDELVPDGEGGTEPRFTFNTLFAKQEDAISALSTLASAFRGMTYWGSDSLVPVADMPEDPVKLVTPANVIEGEFTYSSTSLLERHSVAIVSYNDPDSNYELVPVVYEDPESIKQFGWRELKVTAVACTSRGQALRLARWLLDSERNEKETVTYSAAIDHIDLMPGNIIQIADPDKAGARLGGRVIEANASFVQLDQVPDNLSNSTWYLSCVLPSGTIERREIQGFLQDIVQLVTPFSEAPKPSAVWVISGQDIALPEYRVVSISEKDSGFQVTATEYDRTKYARVEDGVNIERIPSSLIPTGPVPQPQQIEVEVAKYLAGGTLHQKLVVSWFGSTDPRVINHTLQVQRPGDLTWSTTYSGESNTTEILDAEGGEWSFRVRAEGSSLAAPSQWTTLTTQIASELIPAAPTAVDVNPGAFSIRLAPRSPNVLAQYEFWRSTAPLLEAEIESNAVHVVTASNLVDTGLQVNVTYYYYIRGVNAYGVSSWYPLQAQADPDPAGMLELLQGTIGDSQLHQDLGARIDLIDAPGSGLQSQLANEIQNRDAGDSALQQQISSLSSTSDVTIFIQPSDPALSLTVTSLTSSGTTATVVTNLVNYFSVGDTFEVLGAVEPEFNGSATVVSLIDSTSFTFELSSAPSSSPATGTITLERIIGENARWFDTDEGNKPSIWKAGDWFDASDQRVVGHANAIQALETSVSDPATGLQASATKLDELTAGDFSNYAALQQLQTVTLGPDGLTAKMTVKLDVNGYVSGWSSYNDGTETVLAFRADVFTIGHSDATEDITPFILKGSTLYLNSLVVEDASITNAMISNVIESSDGGASWRLDKDGGLRIRNLLIEGPQGEVILQSGDLGVDLSSQIDNNQQTYHNLQGAKPAANLLDVTTWVEGGQGRQGNFTIYGSDAENNIIRGVGPDGSLELLWRAGNDAAYGEDGGWNHPITGAGEGYDSTKSYRMVTWVRQDTFDDPNHLLYFGCGLNHVTSQVNNGASHDNPYFWSGKLPTAGEWYLAVGYLHGSGYTGPDTGKSGIYNPRTGQQVSIGLDWRSSVGATEQSHRALLWNNTTPNDYAWFARPRVDEITGEEPSLHTLMRLATGVAGQQTYRYYGYGYNFTATKAGGLFDEQGVDIRGLGEDPRSYVVSVFDRASMSWDSHTAYDLHMDSAQAPAMATALNALNDTKIVVIQGQQAPVNNRTSGGLPAAIYRCGGSRTVFENEDWWTGGGVSGTNFPTYFLAGVPGTGQGTGIEAFAPAAIGFLEVSFVIRNGTLVNSTYTGDYSPGADNTAANTGAMAHIDQITAANVSTYIESLAVGTLQIADTSIFVPVAANLSSGSFGGGIYGSWNDPGISHTSAVDLGAIVLDFQFASGPNTTSMLLQVRTDVQVQATTRINSYRIVLVRHTDTVPSTNPPPSNMIEAVDAGVVIPLTPWRGSGNRPVLSIDDWIADNPGPGVHTYMLGVQADHNGSVSGGPPYYGYEPSHIPVDCYGASLAAIGGKK